MRNYSFYLFGSMAMLLATSAQAVTISSSTHSKPVFYDFSSPAPFTAYAIPNGVPSGAKFALQNGVLKITNEYAGSFGIDTKLKPFDATQLSHLFFDYKLNPDVKVNIFFRVKGKYYGAVFSGPARVRPGSAMLGIMEGIKADGQWHRAHVPILNWLRQYFPQDATLPVEEVIIGNWDNTNYLMAGFGGNGPGAHFFLDNFALLGAETTASEAKFQLTEDGKTLANPQDYVWSLDGGKAMSLSSASLNVKASDGFHLLRVWNNKSTTPGAAYGFWVSSSVPQIGAPALRGNDVVVPVEASGGLDLKSTKVLLGDKTYDFSSPLLKWDGEALRMAAGTAGLNWKDGAKVEVNVQGIGDLLGRSAVAKSAAFAVDYSKHTQTPPLPEVKLATAQISTDNGTFEQGADEWASEGEGGAIVERDESTAVAGRYSLRLTSPANAAPFRAAIRRSAFDAGKFPIITFDYKVPAALRVDFLLWFDNKPYAIGFTDKDNPWTKLGTIPNVIADDQWHRAEIPLAEWLRKIKPDATTLRVDWLSIGDMGWMGNSRGLQYWIDNFRFVPIERGAPLQADVQLADVTGVKAVSYAIDDRGDSSPSPDKSTLGARIEAAGAGRKWLHVRAQNGAGQWSQPVHLPLWLDGQSPQVALVAPARQARVAPDQMEWQVSDDLALDTGSLAVQVNGKEFSVAASTLQYDRRTNRLSLPARILMENGVSALDDGARVEWKLRPVRDFAGNVAPEQEGSWNYDRSQDKSGPVVRVESATHAALWLEDFESGPGLWRMQEGADVEVVPAEGEGAETNSRVLRVTTRGDKSASTVAAYPRDLDASKWNIVSFRYRIPEKANLAMRLRLGDGRAWHIRLKGESNDSLGAVPGLMADNKWRVATFDLMQFLKRDPKLNPAELKGIDFLDPMRKTPNGVRWEIDNFSLSQAAPSPAKLTWKALDWSGAQKYRVAWDQTATTAPTEETSDTARNFEGAAGTWYFHVQAQDGVGNWGPVLHYPVVIR